MAKRTASSDNPRPSLVRSRAEAARLIREQVDKGIAIRDREIDLLTDELKDAEAAKSRWHAFNVELLGRLFDDASIAEAYDMTIPGSYIKGPSYLERELSLREDVSKYVTALESVLERLPLIPERSPCASVIAGLKDFFQANLRRAMLRDPANETDVQDVVEQLLIGRGFSKGVDYDRETGRVKVSIKEVIPDFVLPRLDTALEVKLSKDRNRSKEIVDEINADIASYGKKYANCLFVVYDMGSIRDEAEFKHGLETANGVSVVVVKH